MPCQVFSADLVSFLVRRRAREVAFYAHKRAPGSKARDRGGLVQRLRRKPCSCGNRAAPIGTCSGSSNQRIPAAAGVGREFKYGRRILLVRAVIVLDIAVVVS